MQDLFITGSGHSAFGRLEQNLEELIVQVSREALEEAALDAGQIDAIFLGHFNSGLVSDGFPSSLVLQAFDGLRFVPAARCENACASGAAAVHAGMNYLRANGKARHVLVVGAEKMTHRPTSEVTQALSGAGYQNDPDEQGLSFAQVFALFAQAYGQRYSDPLETMAHIASKNHNNAMNNPLAQMHRALSVEACNTVSDKNPLIAPPLRLTDCSLVSDGAAAVVISSDAAARSARYRVKIAAAEQVSDYLPLSRRDYLRFEGPKLAIERAYEKAGVTVGEIDFAEVHDCFTIAELLVYEAMGLAPAGRGGDAVMDGTVMAGGRLPVNLSGGLKAKGHPVGATGVSMHALGFRQLTNRAGAFQKAGAETGLLFNMGGAAVANYATVLRADKA